MNLDLRIAGAVERRFTYRNISFDSLLTNSRGTHGLSPLHLKELTKRKESGHLISYSARPNTLFLVRHRDRRILDPVEESLNRFAAERHVHGRAKLIKR